MTNFPKEIETSRNTQVVDWLEGGECTEAWQDKFEGNPFIIWTSSTSNSEIENNKMKMGQ